MYVPVCLISDGISCYVTSQLFVLCTAGFELSGVSHMCVSGSEVANVFVGGYHRMGVSDLFVFAKGVKSDLVVHICLRRQGL